MTSQPRYSRIVIVSRMKVSASSRVPKPVRPWAERLQAKAVDRIDLALDEERARLLDVAHADELAALLARRAERELLRLDGRLAHLSAFVTAWATVWRST